MYRNSFEGSLDLYGLFAEGISTHGLRVPSDGQFQGHHGPPAPPRHVEMLKVSRRRHWQTGSRMPGPSIDGIVAVTYFGVMFIGSRYVYLHISYTRSLWVAPCPGARSRDPDRRSRPKYRKHHLTGPATPDLDVTAFGLATAVSLLAPLRGARGAGLRGRGAGWSRISGGSEEVQLADPSWQT